MSKDFNKFIRSTKRYIELIEDSALAILYYAHINEDKQLEGMVMILQYSIKQLKELRDQFSE